MFPGRLSTGVSPRRFRECVMRDAAQRFIELPTRSLSV
jgi:hypothetical protein